MSENIVSDAPTYRDQTVRLGDLAALDDVIEGVVFERCQIVGPAVIALLGDTKVTNCGWSGAAEGIVWPTHDRDEVVGAIGLKDCLVTDCEFYRVGLAVPDDQLDAVRAGFGLA